MDKLIEILEDINPGVDYQNTIDLIDGHYLDSMSVISLIAELEEEFDISIPGVEVIPDNFNSAEKIMAMITRLQEEY